MKSFLFLLSLFVGFCLFCGCASTGSSTLQPGEQLGTSLAPGLYTFDTQRVSHEYDGELFYKDGLAKVELEAGNRYRVTLLEQRGGNFALVPKGSQLVIADDHMGFANVGRDLKGKGMMLVGNFARGTCQIKLENAGRRDYRNGTWTLRPANEWEAGRLKK